MHEVINAAGTMSWMGSSLVVPEALSAANEMATRSVVMAELQERASLVISRLTGAEAGVVTGCCAAAVTQSVAATLTGSDRNLIRQLPDGVTGNEVVIQASHLVSFGASIEQLIRMTGATVCVVEGAKSGTMALDASITGRTRAGVFVVSHMVDRSKELPLEDFILTFHRRGLPVIVDAASESHLRRFIDMHADLVLFSSHKAFGGMTAGIVAGRSDLVESVYLQSSGIGRTMKVGKEAIASTIAALEAWSNRDHPAATMRTTKILKAWGQILTEQPGIVTELEPDPTGNPIIRLKVTVKQGVTGFSAVEVASKLACGDPAIFVRDHCIDDGYFWLDASCLKIGDNLRVADALQKALRAVLHSGSIEPLTKEWYKTRHAKTRIPEF